MSKKLGENSIRTGGYRRSIISKAKRLNKMLIIRSKRLEQIISNKPITFTFASSLALSTRSLQEAYNDFISLLNN